MIYVVIHLGGGDLNSGFPNVRVQLLQSGYLRYQWQASLPEKPELELLYSLTKKQYLSLYDSRKGYVFLRDGNDEKLNFDEGSVTNVSDTRFFEAKKQLEWHFNVWLQSPSFARLESRLRSQLNTQAEILVIIETPEGQKILQRLPWYSWSFFADYQNAGVALNRQEFGNNISKKELDKIRILVIEGDTQGIDVDEEKKFLMGLENVELEFVERRSREQVFNQLWSELGWDIIFFAGHSKTENGSGVMYLLDEQGKKYSLSIDELRNALNKAKKRLKLAIFNSCDGLGLAYDLGKLDIPYVIFMGEPVPNEVAVKFFRYFLDAFALKKLPLPLAEREARLRLQGLEGEFPGASWLPVLYHNSGAAPLNWDDWKPSFWFWEQLKKRANTQANWISFEAFKKSGEQESSNVEEDENPVIRSRVVLGFVTDSSQEKVIPVKQEIKVNTPYFLNINLEYPGYYLVILNQGLSDTGEFTKYLICPSKLVAPNYRLNSRGMKLPQKDSMRKNDGIMFNTVGKEELIALLLEQPLNFPWVTTTQNNPLFGWDTQEIKQLWDYLKGRTNWQAFYCCFEVL